MTILFAHTSLDQQFWVQLGSSSGLKWVHPYGYSHLGPGQSKGPPLTRFIFTNPGFLPQANLLQVSLH